MRVTSAVTYIHTSPSPPAPAEKKKKKNPNINKSCSKNKTYIYTRPPTRSHSRLQSQNPENPKRKVKKKSNQIKSNLVGTSNSLHGRRGPAHAPRRAAVSAQLLHLLHGAWGIPRNCRVINAYDNALLIGALPVVPPSRSAAAAGGGVFPAGVEVHLQRRVDREIFWEGRRRVWRRQGTEVTDKGFEFWAGSRVRAGMQGARQ
jgi:hypothetical protein